jgi:hypothetical protein
MWHDDVGDYQIETLRKEFGECVSPVFGESHDMPGAPQGRGDLDANQRFVVDHQNASHRQLAH